MLVVPSGLRQIYSIPVGFWGVPCLMKGYLAGKMRCFGSGQFACA